MKIMANLIRFSNRKNTNILEGYTMPQAPRPNKVCMKIVYKILATPKEKQQENQRMPSRKQVNAWFRDTLMSQ